MPDGTSAATAIVRVRAFIDATCDVGKEHDLLAIAPGDGCGLPLYRSDVVVVLDQLSVIVGTASRNHHALLGDVIEIPTVEIVRDTDNDPTA